jgi:hypothetical protein
LGNQKISENHPFLITLGIGLSRSGSLPSNLKIGVMGFEMFIFFDTNRNRQEGPYDSCIQEYISTPASIFRYMLSNINCI